eukprot:scaffold44685_cov33-Tisochrysis_lutea.AAC.2
MCLALAFFVGWLAPFDFGTSGSRTHPGGRPPGLIAVAVVEAFSVAHKASRTEGVLVSECFPVVDDVHAPSPVSSLGVDSFRMDSRALFIERKRRSFGSMKVLQTYQGWGTDG